MSWLAITSTSQMLYLYMTDMNDCCLSYLESSGIGMWCLPPVVYGCYGYNGFTFITIVHVELMLMVVSLNFSCFWGAEGAPILFSDLGLRMASCSYIYIYFCHFANGGAHVVLYKALNPL